MPVLPRQERRRRDEDRPLEVGRHGLRHQGFEGKIHGKKDLINNFCQAVPSNEGRCSQCHIGIGWGDKDFDFSNPKNIDCLACHDQTGTYKKVPTPTATRRSSADPT